MKYKMSFYHLGKFNKVVLYEPEEPVEKSKIALICMHSNGDYSDFPAGKSLAEKGYRVLCGKPGTGEGPLYKKLEAVKKAIEGAKKLPGVERVILLGHSGGATLMSCYQAVAENGCQIFQGEKMIVPMPDIEPLPAADGILLLDSNFGNSVMTAISIDPAVIDEESGVKLDPELDSFNPANGFSKEGAHYSLEFKKKYLAGQKARYGRLIDKALERYAALENHQGKYFDDEPFYAPGACTMALNNRLFPQDISLLAHTEDEYKLIHPDGSITTEIIRSVRKPRGMSSPTPLFVLGASRDTVKEFLTGGAIRLTDEYDIDETHISGLDLDSCYSCTIGNSRYISCPALIMGMTAGYECIAAESIWRNIGSRDKDIAFVEGATHMIVPEKGDVDYGDTIETTFKYVDGWLEKHFC
ncbi:MAG: alpha/beta hydrolase [Lachnospiraceae bacterium]